MWWRASALLDRYRGYIPVALSKSQGAGSVWTLVHLSGAHLYIQVLGNKSLNGCCGSRHFSPNGLDQLGTATPKRAYIIPKTD
jgi:hypothetical protein